MREIFDRRNFLRAAAVTAAGAAAACGRTPPEHTTATPSSGVPAPRAASSAPGTASAPAAGAPAATGARTAPSPADWKALGKGLTGRLIRPGDASYDAARRLFNTSFDGVRPGAVAYCADPDDIAECLAFARRTGVPVTSRSGGHGYAGWSTGTGLVIDVSRMNGVKVAGGRAVVGAGAQLVDVYARLAARGVSIPAGSCPTVGVAGLTLGGGLGVVSRKYGLTCDVLESLKIVTADGRLRTCDADHDPELYWASRGGGGGNFGVAVSFTFRTHPTRDVTVFYLHWPWSRAAKVTAAWQAWAPHAPDALWSTLHLSHDPTPDVLVAGLHLGPRAECERLLAAFAATAGTPSRRTVRQMPYLAAMMDLGGCGSRTVSQCHRRGDLPGQTPDGTFPRDSFRAKSHMAYRPLTSAGVAALVAQVGRGGRHTVLLDALGGAVGRPGPDATAFPHREALFSVQYYAHTAGAATWVRGAHAAMAPHFGDHAYVNYIDPELKNWRQAYYGANAARLAKVKAAYDPGRLFRFPQAV
ncbi:FAD-binding dehydrogenase [Sphaerisporangium siamense]|uniref:FAD/FMN-containing dehydrogenase n=1 Tax=Sphaerisporangium siamense TaxID=795645 RepID=A0A7W7GG85_9ACTN|nr:FAD-binding oxidoreductase [Sphaerisporangium siamense]MBB4705821.1 FAD/FMN-containing dehydrogenase [Sphaerisporangium siamense]GII82789.1 FAD-binding dehydrogenase [Sphaerisporangium siamense]